MFSTNHRTDALRNGMSSFPESGEGTPSCMHGEQSGSERAQLDFPPSADPAASQGKAGSSLLAGPTTDTSFPIVTANLPSLQPGQMAPSHRPPLVIKGSSKIPVVGVQQGRTGGKRRALASLIAIGLCLIVALSALVVLVPVDQQGHTNLSNLFGQRKIDLVPGKSNNDVIDIPSEMAKKAQQVDGYDPIAHLDILPPLLANGSTINRFYQGQCTYWANIRYHELTGVWIPWLGDAYQWYYQAMNYHWHTSDRPNPRGPSIIVLGPYAQNSYSALGHVAVVEKDNGNGTVLTSNMHWPVLGHVSYVTFTYPTQGTHFIWAT